MSTATIRQILGGRELFSVSPDTPLRQVAQNLKEHGVGAVAVMDGDDLVGIISERDIVYRGVAEGLAMDDAKATDVMTVEPVTVNIEDGFSDALAAHLGDWFRHLPVMENGKVAGLLSYRDIPAEYVMMFERFREMSSSRADGN